MTLRNLLPAAISAALLLAVPVAASAQATASASDGRNGLIAFQSDRAGSNDIYTIRPDGTRPTRLTGAGGPNRRPRFSPDGRRIAFQSNRDGNWEIYVMKADGSHQTRLTENAAFDDFPDWSPDGQRIVFQRGNSGDTEIYSMSAAGGGEVDLTNNPAGDITPASSPVDGRIAFASDRSGSSLIYTLRANGSGVRQVSSGTGFDFNPNWSPDGRTLVFLRDTTGIDNDIFVVRSDAGGLRRLTTTPNRVEFGASFSPDGRRIVFSGCTTQCHLYSVNLSGGDERQITFGRTAPSTPYSENFDNNAFNPDFWLSFGPTGTGSPGPTLTPTNGELEFAFAANTVADPNSGFAAVQMVSRCQLLGDFDFQVDFRLLDWPVANGVNFALGAESLNTVGAMSLSRLSDGGERYGAFTRLADGSESFAGLTTSDQQGTLRVVRSGPIGTVYMLSAGSWVPILSTTAPSGELQITLTAATQDSVFGHQPVRAAFDNFQLSSGTFDSATCGGVNDRFPDWQANDD
jgi:Tol biopolymer transport system component